MRERTPYQSLFRRWRNETLRDRRAPLHNSALPPSKSRLALLSTYQKGLLTQNVPSRESPLCSVLSLFAARRDHQGATATTRLPGREPRRDRQGVTARSQSLLSTVKTKRPTGKSRHCRASLASQTDTCASHSRLPVSRGQRPARRCPPAHGVRAQAPRPERPNCPSTHLCAGGADSESTQQCLVHLLGIKERRRVRLLVKILHFQPSSVQSCRAGYLCSEEISYQLLVQDMEVPLLPPAIRVAREMHEFRTWTVRTGLERTKARHQSNPARQPA